MSRNSPEFELHSRDAAAPLRARGLVLAAGLGTRIGALTRHRPKPLLPVGLTTPFARAVAELARGGVDRAVGNASHLAPQLIEAGRSLAVEIVVETSGPLGTAGGVAACRSSLLSRDGGHATDAVVVWNGDVVADVDVAALLESMSGLPAIEAVFAVHGVGEAGVGNVGLDTQGRIVRLRDRLFPSIGHEARGGWFSAIHAMRASIVEACPARGCLIGDVYFGALARGADLRAVEHAGRWHDIGDVASYLAANRSLLAGAASAIGEGALIDPGIELESVVVGHGARVEGHGLVRDVVIWPGAHATAPLHRAIVTTSGEVVHVP